MAPYCQTHDPGPICQSNRDHLTENRDGSKCIPKSSTHSAEGDHAQRLARHDASCDLDEQGWWRSQESQSDACVRSICESFGPSPNGGDESG
jgi:hypothetical protein